MSVVATPLLILDCGLAMGHQLIFLGDFLVDSKVPYDL